MGDFMNGFWGGFLTTTNKNINDRFDRAEEYYNSQLELAYTKGIQNQAELENRTKSTLASAKQLQAMGMPVDLVKSIASGNPDDIPTIAEQLASLQTKGYKTDDAFFRAWVQSSKDFSDNNEDLGSFFKRIYKPLSRNIEADPEGMKRDPVGGFWSTIMGFNAMDNARRKLDTTEIMDGYSASDLLAMDANKVTVGDSPVTLNYNTYGDALRSTRPTRSTIPSSQKPPTTAEINSINKSYKEEVEKLTHEAMIANGSGASVSDEQRMEIEGQAAANTAELFGASKVGYIAPIAEKLGMGSREEAPEAPMPSEPLRGPVEPQLPSEPPPPSPTPQAAPTAPTEAPEATSTPELGEANIPAEGLTLGGGLTGWKLLKNLGDGTVVLSNPKGEKVRVKREDFVKHISGDL